jgi:succinate dehydrogenase/fumarate reductase-like Fe-S protein
MVNMAARIQASKCAKPQGVQRLYALVILAWGLLRSLFAPLLGKRRGLPEFKASYAADRLPPVSDEERKTLPLLGGCIACGLCDYGEGIRAAQSAGRYAGTMDLMLASSRSMPDYDAAALSFAMIEDERLAELEARCPARVPMRKVAALVRNKARELA